MKKVSENITFNVKDEIIKEFSKQDTLAYIDYIMHEGKMFGNLTDLISSMAHVIADVKDSVYSAREANASYYDQNTVCDYLKGRLVEASYTADQIVEDGIPAYRKMNDIPDNLSIVEGTMIGSIYAEKADTVIAILNWLRDEFDLMINNLLPDLLDPKAHISLMLDKMYQQFDDVIISLKCKERVANLNREEWQQRLKSREQINNIPINLDKIIAEYLAKQNHKPSSSPQTFEFGIDIKKQAISFAPATKEEVIDAVLKSDALKDKRPLAMFVGGSRLYRVDNTQADLDLYVFIGEKAKEIYFGSKYANSQNSLIVSGLKIDLHVMDMRSLYAQLKKQNPTLFELFLEKPIWKNDEIDCKFFNYLTNPAHQRILRNVNPKAYLMALRGMTNGVIKELNSGKARGVKDVDKIIHFAKYWHSINQDELVLHKYLLGSEYHQKYYQLMQYDEEQSEYSELFNKFKSEGLEKLGGIKQMLYSNLSIKLFCFFDNTYFEKQLEGQLLAYLRKQAIIDSL